MRADGATATIISRLDVPALRGVLAVIENLAQTCHERIDEIETIQRVRRDAGMRVGRCFESGEIAARLVRAGGDFDASCASVAERLGIRCDTVAAHCKRVLRDRARADRRARDLEITRLAWGGFSNIAIAARMGLARETVSRIIRRELRAWASNMRVVGESGTDSPRQGAAS